jgi:hypothetical protein
MRGKFTHRADFSAKQDRNDLKKAVFAYLRYMALSLLELSANRVNTDAKCKSDARSIARTTITNYETIKE